MVYGCQVDVINNMQLYVQLLFTRDYFQIRYGRTQCIDIHTQTNNGYINREYKHDNFTVRL